MPNDAIQPVNVDPPPPGLGRRLFKFMHRTDGSLQSKAVRSGAWVAVASVGGAVLMFVRGIVLAWLLPPAVFGVMAIALMTTRFIEIFTETGFGAALIHRQKRFEDARDTAFTMMFVRGIGLAGLSVLIAPWMAAFYEQPALTGVISVAGISFILSGCLNLNTIGLQKELDNKRLAYMDLIGTVLRVLSSVALAFWLRSVWALVIAQIVNAAIGTVLSFIMVPGRIRFRFDRTIARELYSYGRFITGLAVVVFLTRELDNALVGKLLGMEALGYYVVAYSLATIPSDHLSRFISRVLFPMFSKLQNDSAALCAEYIRGLRIITTIAVLVSVGMAVLAPQIVGALYGGRWAPATAPLAILAVFSCFRALWLLNGYCFNAIGRPHIDFYTNAARLVVMATLLYPLAVRYGLPGAALAVTVPMVLQFCFGVYLSRRFIGAPISASLGPLLTSVVQGVVLAVVLLAAKMALSVDARIALPFLLLITVATSLALNYRELRTIYAAVGAR